MSVLQAGSRFGPYEIVELLGEGGMGRVYRARDTRLNREVALKVLQSGVVSATRDERLMAEARLISTLTHPHIRAVYDAVEHEGHSAIVMEYLDGKTLDRKLAHKPIPLEVALAYGEQLARALDAAHSKGIVHRDVKLANIIVTKEGVKLLDFGVATLREAIDTGRDALEASTQTGSGNGAGTTAYMAPEQLEGLPVDPRADIFALGMVMYQMIAGVRPFEASSKARMIAAILERRPASLTSLVQGLPPAIDRAVMKCLEKNPNDRWQHAGDLASELAWLQRNETGPAVVVSASPPWWRGSLPMAAVTSAIALLVAIVAFRSTPPAATPPAVRFLASAPSNSFITVAAGAFALSPDGRHLAFTASSEGGPRLLWIRSLDAFEAQPLNGTDGAAYPFWSPDSRTVAFFSGTRLKAIEIDGSPLRLITSTPKDAQWGSWSSRGDIIFTAQLGASLHRVRASGGAPEQVASAESSPAGQWGGLAYLPDGEHFLIASIDDMQLGDQVRVYVGSAENPTERLLFRAESTATYAEPGYLLYIRAGNLIAQSFDPRTRETSGEPVSLPEPTAFGRVQRRASVSVSQTGVLAYRQRATTSQLTWFDRSGRKLGTVGAPGRYINPSLAPDARRVAVTRLSSSPSESDIWLFEPRGERPFTVAPGMEDHAVWSPDGRRIAFSSDEDRVLNLYVKDLSASAEEPGTVLLKNNRQKLPMDWTPDQKHVLFLDSKNGTIPWLPLLSPVDAADRGDMELASADPSASSRNEFQAQVSPDGRWIAYVSDFAGAAQVYVSEFPNGRRKWQISTSGGFEPKWRGDSRELFYIAPDQQLMSVPITVTASDLQAGRPTPLFKAGVLGAPYQVGLVRNEYAVTGDGARFLINQPTDGAPPYAIRVVVNWPSLLPR